MFLDSQLQFSAAQALAGTGVSTNIIDTGANAFAGFNVDRNVGIGEPICVVIDVIVAADLASGDETYQFDLQTDTVVGFGSLVAVVSRVISRALLVAGSQWVMPVPPDTHTSRFLRMNYVLGGTTPSITVTSTLTLMSMLQNYIAHPDALTIS